MALTVFYTESNQTLKRVSVIMASKMKKRQIQNYPCFVHIYIYIYTYTHTHKHWAVYIHPGLYKQPQEMQGHIPESRWISAIYVVSQIISTVKPVKLTTFIRWPPTDVDRISVEPTKSYIVCIYDHLRNFSTVICWIPVYVSHAKWNRGTVYTCLYWLW